MHPDSENYNDLVEYNRALNARFERLLGYDTMIKKLQADRDADKKWMREHPDVGAYVTYVSGGLVRYGLVHAIHLRDRKIVYEIKSADDLPDEFVDRMPGHVAVE